MHDLIPFDDCEGCAGNIQSLELFLNISIDLCIGVILGEPVGTLVRQYRAYGEKFEGQGHDRQDSD